MKKTLWSRRGPLWVKGPFGEWNMALNLYIFRRAGQGDLWGVYADNDATMIAGPFATEQAAQLWLDTEMTGVDG